MRSGKRKIVTSSLEATTSAAATLSLKSANGAQAKAKRAAKESGSSVIEGRMVHRRKKVASRFQRLGVLLAFFDTPRKCGAFLMAKDSRRHGSSCCFSSSWVPAVPGQFSFGKELDWTIKLQRVSRLTRRQSQRQSQYIVPPLYESVVEPDYLITDSVDVHDRPSLLNILSHPNALLRMTLLVLGAGISLLNVLGNYGGLYLSLEVAAIALGILTSLVDSRASIPPYGVPSDTVSPNIRTGTMDDAVVHLYAAVYTASAAWLALRSSPLCPSWFALLDPVCGSAAAAIFIFSLFAPLLTIFHDTQTINAEGLLRTMVAVARQGSGEIDEPLPKLTETEDLRAKSLLGVGMVGCLFAPIALKFALSGQDWWLRVLASFPEQGILESSTALFGIFATQASMVAHKAAKAGVAPFLYVAPAFVVVCFVLTIVPCGCALYWLQDISFLAHYSL